MKNVFQFLCILTTTLSTAHWCLYHYLIYRCLLLTNLSPALSPLHRLTCYTDAMSAWVQFVVHFRCCIQVLNSGLKRSAVLCSGNFLCLFTANCLLHNHWHVFSPSIRWLFYTVLYAASWSHRSELRCKVFCFFPFFFFPHCIITRLCCALVSRPRRLL